MSTIDKAVRHEIVEPAAEHEFYSRQCAKLA